MVASGAILIFTRKLIPNAAVVAGVVIRRLDFHQKSYSLPKSGVQQRRRIRTPPNLVAIGLEHNYYELTERGEFSNRQGVVDIEYVWPWQLLRNAVG
jgi:hypothetical protein